MADAQRAADLALKRFIATRHDAEQAQRSAAVAELQAVAALRRVFSVDQVALSLGLTRGRVQEILRRLESPGPDNAE